MPEFFSCPVCRNRVAGFAPLPSYYSDNARKHGYPYALDDHETINHSAYSCPVCVSSDRDRLYAAFFEPLFAALDRTRLHLFLEIAPSRAFAHWVKSHPHVAHRSCDLYMPEVDDRADICALPYADNTFDFVLCSHVLEHVDDVVKAASELRRVLRPDGVALLMVPICNVLTETYENPAVKTPEDRWKHFGQDDHVRLFARAGFVKTLETAGFHTSQVPVTNLMNEARCEVHGISPRSVIYIGTKEKAEERQASAA